MAFIDGARGELLRVAPDGDGGTRMTLAAELGFLAAAPDGRLLYGSGTTIGRVGVAGDFATVPGDAARLRLNDAGFDAAGGLWTGTMDRSGQAPLGALWRVDPSGQVEAALDGFTIPNGFALDRAGRTLYVADSPRRVVHALELGRDGRLRARRAFAAGDALCAGYPDGMAVDAEDHLWIAFYEGGCLGRFRPDGSLERRCAARRARDRLRVRRRGARDAVRHRRRRPLRVRTRRHGLTARGAGRSASRWTVPPGSKRRRPARPPSRRSRRDRTATADARSARRATAGSPRPRGPARPRSAPRRRSCPSAPAACPGRRAGPPPAGRSAATAMATRRTADGAARPGCVRPRCSAPAGRSRRAARPRSRRPAPAGSRASPAATARAGAPAAR